MLTGKKPYDDDNCSVFEIQMSIVTKPLDLSDVPEAWRGFLAPYLEKDPQKRPALRRFEAAPPSIKADDDHAGKTESKKQLAATVAAPQPKKPINKPQPQESASEAQSKPPVVEPQPSESQDKPKGKIGLWIGLGVAAVAVLLVVLLKKPKEEPVVVDPDTEAYQACQTVADYRDYMRDFGRNALHYADARSFVDRYVADSTQRVQDSLAQAKAREQAEAAMKQEDEAYQKCTTVAACDSYLKAYPQGRYVAEVTQKRAELEKNAPKNGSHNGHDYVDLGLPSGTLWATCNVGASSPEGYGNYYAWGETSTKNTYNWDTYKYANGDYDELTKYCNKSDYGNNGFTDMLTQLQSGDDAATSAWGSGWRTPSKTQWDELLENTTNKWTTQNGKKGRLFTSKKNGQTLFLPAAGSRWDDELKFAGSNGYYSSLDTGYPDRAWYLDFDSGNCDMNGGSRRGGFTMRPVRSSRQN